MCVSIVLTLLSSCVQEQNSDIVQPAAQHCIGADGTEVIGMSSKLPAAAQLHR